MELASASCSHEGALKLTGHIVTLVSSATIELVGACPSCSYGWDARGAGGELSPEDAQAIDEFIQARRLLNDSIAGGIACSALCDPLPSPVWFARLGLAPTISEATLLGHAALSDEALLRTEIRQRFGLSAQLPNASIATPIGLVTVGEIFENHLFEVDLATGKDRRDPGHVFFIPAVRETLTNPTEIWEFQEGGRRRRRLMYLKLYILAERLAYHIAIVTRDRHLLSSHKINGFNACQNRRVGLPRYAAY